MNHSRRFCWADVYRFLEAKPTIMANMISHVKRLYARNVCQDCAAAPWLT
jgi:hypothetical protein